MTPSRMNRAASETAGAPVPSISLPLRMSVTPVAVFMASFGSGFAQDDHAWVEVFRLRVQPRRGQQFLDLAVVEVNVAFALAAEALGDEGDVAPVRAERRRVFVRPRVEARQRH